MSVEKRDLICIGCPVGCNLTVTLESGSVMKVEGNTCPKGDTYARKEVTNPTRIVTSTVEVIGGSRPFISVKTKNDIPKDKIFECMEEIKQIRVMSPVHMGDIIIENVAGTGISIVATKNA
jgi:CxxC motif-containing protein